MTPRSRTRRSGLTLVELIVSFSILLILSTMALPLMHIRVQREKERRLREALDTMRTAIDRYKDAADAGLLGELDPDNHGYPESLEVLVEGVEVQSGGGLPGMNPGMTPGLEGQQGGAFGGRQSSFGQQRNSGFGSRPTASSFGRQQGSSGSRGNSPFGSQSGFGEDDEEKKIRFLRKIPVDPITGQSEWGMRSVTDSPDSTSWGGDNVFDVYSLSMQTALNGTRYSEW